MERAKEAEQFRKTVVQTLVALLIAAILLVITFIWLFGRLIG
jgi:flagellar biogenesis protein FliO